MINFEIYDSFILRKRTVTKRVERSQRTKVNSIYIEKITWKSYLIELMRLRHFLYRTKEYSRSAGESTSDVTDFS